MCCVARLLLLITNDVLCEVVVVVCVCVNNRIFRGYIARHRYYDLLQSVRNKREDKQIDYMNWKK
jgi:hypothetical protein